jgi:hypothetical protein
MESIFFGACSGRLVHSETCYWYLRDWQFAKTFRSIFFEGDDRRRLDLENESCKIASFIEHEGMCLRLQKSSAYKQHFARHN